MVYDKHSIDFLKVVLKNSFFHRLNLSKKNFSLSRHGFRSTARWLRPRSKHKFKSVCQREIQEISIIISIVSFKNNMNKTVLMSRFHVGSEIALSFVTYILRNELFSPLFTLPDQAWQWKFSMKGQILIFLLCR